MNTLVYVIVIFFFNEQCELILQSAYTAYSRDFIKKMDFPAGFTKRGASEKAAGEHTFFIKFYQVNICKHMYQL